MGKSGGSKNKVAPAHPADEHIPIKGEESRTNPMASAAEDVTPSEAPVEEPMEDKTVEEELLEIFGGLSPLQDFPYIVEDPETGQTFKFVSSRFGPLSALLIERPSGDDLEDAAHWTLKNLDNICLSFGLEVKVADLPYSTGLLLSRVVNHLLDFATMAPVKRKEMVDDVRRAIEKRRAGRDTEDDGDSKN